MNNVKGTDYPYLYAVVLGKGDFRFPKAPGRRRVGGVDLVIEAGESEGVRYRVIRQHADTERRLAHRARRRSAGSSTRPRSTGRGGVARERRGSPA